MQIDEAALTQYALGTLDSAEQGAVRKAIAASPALQKELAAIRNTLQYVAHLEQPLPPGDRVRRLILDSIEEPTRFSGLIQRFSRLFELDTEASESLLGKIDQPADPAWQSTLFPGVSIMKFAGGPTLASATCGIVQVQAGRLFPAHQHQGDEKTLVLQGTAQDDRGNRLTMGDLFLLSTGSRHSFRVIGNETFIFAVVLYQDNKWLWIKTLRDHMRIR